MKVWHIIPKEELNIPVGNGRSVSVEEICVADEGKQWLVKTQSPWDVADMTGLTQAIRTYLSIGGQVQVDHHVLTIHHGGDMPLVPDEDDALGSVADISADDLEGYDIPHEDCYESIYDDDDAVLYDDDYKKACKVAEEGPKKPKRSGSSAGSAVSSDSRVWLGQSFSGDVTPINDVLTEERNDVIFKGKIVKVDTREFESGRVLLLFQIADKTNGISVKTFLNVGNKGGGKYRRKNSLTQEEYDALKGNITGRNLCTRPWQCPI
jgi:DNA polymerase-3 subunit alpha (Gram-positive type)